MQSALAGLSDYITLREVCRRLGASYTTAYHLGASGVLGEPVVIGRTQFFPRSTAEQAIEQRRRQIATHGKRAPLTAAVA